MTSVTMQRTRHRPYRVQRGGSGSGGGSGGNTNTGGLTNIISNTLPFAAVSDSYQRVGQFSNDGTPEDMAQIRKKGLCPTCGRVRTHRKRASLLNVGSGNGLGAFYMDPLTKEGEVYEGYCLKCHTMDEVLQMPNVSRRSPRKERKSKTNNRIDRHEPAPSTGAPPSTWSVGSGSLGGPGVDVTMTTSNTRARQRTTDESIDDLTETSLSFDYDYGCDDIASFSGLSIDEGTEEDGDGGTTMSSDFGSSVQTPASSRGGTRQQQQHHHTRSYSVEDGRGNVSSNAARRSQSQQRTHIRSSSAENSVEVSSLRHGAHGDDKTMKSIVRDMMKCPNDPAVQEFGCVALGRHAHEPVRRLVAAIDVIVEAMNAHPDRVGVQVEACRTFRRFTSASSRQTAGAGSKDRKRSVCAGDDIEVNVEACSKLVVLGGVFAVLSAMKDHPDSLAVQKAGIRVVRNALRANQHARTTIVEADGAVGTITRAMWMHDSSVQLQEDGCVVLWSLAYNDVDTQFDIVRGEGVGAIVKAMSTHRDVEKVHYHACGALHTLSFDEDVKRAVLDYGGTFSAIFGSMREHGYSELVTERACSALVNLAVSVDSGSGGGSSPESCRSSSSSSSSSATNRLCVMKENEIATLLYQMEVHKSSPSIQRSACRLLAIAARSRSNLMSLRDNPKLRPILREAAENFPDDCVDSASYVLSLIDTRRR